MTEQTQLNEMHLEWYRVFKIRMYQQKSVEIAIHVTCKNMKQFKTTCDHQN